MPAVLFTPHLSPAYIDRLPTELILRIGHSFVQRDPEGCVDPKDSFILVAVSRRWREIFLKYRSFWGRVWISKEEGAKKMDCMLEKGAPRSVSLDVKSRPIVLKLLFDRIQGNLASLTSLSIPINRIHGLEAVWDLLASSLLLTDLHLTNTDSNLRRITAPSSPILLSNLTYLELRNFKPTHDHSIFSLLQRTPKLQILKLLNSPVTFAPSSSSSSRTISLPDLDTIDSHLSPETEYDSAGDWKSPIFLAPRLRCLNLPKHVPFSTFLFPPHPHPPNVNGLRRLQATFIKDRTYTETSLIAHLRQAWGLDDLILEGPISDALIEALTRKPGQKNCCPFLDTLLLLGNYEVSAEAVVKMVLSREWGFDENDGDNDPEGLSTLWFGGVGAEKIDEEGLEVLREVEGLDLRVYHEG